MSNIKIKSRTLNKLTDKEILQERLEWEGFTETKVKSDGNCLFRAIAHQLYDNSSDHQRVRQEIIKQLKSCPKLYKGLVGQEYSKYVEKMSKESEWGDDVTLKAAANAYKVKILVITSYKDDPFSIYLPKSEKEPDKTICLSYLAGIHFNSIHLKQVGSSLGGSTTTSLRLQQRNGKKKKKEEEEERQREEKREEKKKDKEDKRQEKKDKKLKSKKDRKNKTKLKSQFEFSNL